MNLIFCIIVLILTNFTIATAPPINVVFIIQSQDTTYQNELSRNLKEDIIKQSFELQPKYRIKVHVLHEIFNYPGGWTIHNLIPQLMLYQRKSHMDNINTNTEQQIEMKMGMKIETETGKREEGEGEGENIITNNNTRWIVFCEDTTKLK
ncbi:hypothetical protein DOY81_002596 [Sarcophaga bullata]|nr:hypothetical protein DOY81_002596 [Sarcophaga bullata]